MVPGGGLGAHEAQGGHLIRKHIGRTEDQLRARLIAEPRIPVASTFATRSEAESTVSDVIDKNKDRISAFLNGEERRLAIIQPVPAPAGVGVVRRSGNLEQLSKVRLILQKNPSLPSGYFILTGYVDE